MPEEITELTELILSKVPNIIRYNNKDIINETYIKYKSSGTINNHPFFFKIKRINSRLCAELNMTENSYVLSLTISLIQTRLNENFIINHETCDEVLKKLYKGIKHFRINQ